MTPEEELALISTLLDELGIPKTLGLGVYSTYGRVDLLAKKVQLTPVPADEGGAVTVIDAIDDPQGLITGKPGRFYPAHLRR